MKPIITLITDFGTKDPFVGQMKGVIKNINPDAEVIDITHEIQPFDIREAAFVVGMSYQYFPQKTVHVVVVDPGVGSERRPLLVGGERHYFVGPDNGVFSLVYQKEKSRVIHITADHYFLKKPSSTFHGRDIFAPVASWITRGIEISNFGREITDYKKISFPEPRWVRSNVLEGQVIYIDRFGNAITNISNDMITPFLEKKNPMKIIIKKRIIPFRRFYTEAKENELSCLINSFGLLEFFLKNGNAHSTFDIKIGDIVGILFG